MSNRYPASPFTDNNGDTHPPEHPAADLAAADLAPCEEPANGVDPRQLEIADFRPLLEGSPGGTPSCAALRAAFAQRRQRSEGSTKDTIQALLGQLGEDPDREGLRETPRRVMESLHFLTDGYQMDVGAIIDKALFTADADEMVIVRDTEFYSLCEHHMLPFFGKVHVGYIPEGKIVGLSKIPRVIDCFAHRLQVQERLTTQIANALMTHLKPRGVAVVIEAQHLCMLMRGVQKYGSDTITSAVTGVFQRDARTRAEFMDFVHGRR